MFLMKLILISDKDNQSEYKNAVYLNDDVIY